MQQQREPHLPHAYSRPGLWSNLVYSRLARALARMSRCVHALLILRPRRLRAFWHKYHGRALVIAVIRRITDFYRINFMPSHGSHRRIVDDGTGTRERWGKRLREEWGERTMIIPPPPCRERVRMGKLYELWQCWLVRLMTKIKTNVKEFTREVSPCAIYINQNQNHVCQGRISIL